MRASSQHKEQKMAIIDFQYPTLTQQGWAVSVYKKDKLGQAFSNKITFESKDDAFAYYNTIREMWKQQGKQR